MDNNLFTTGKLNNHVYLNQLNNIFTESFNLAGSYKIKRFSSKLNPETDIQKDYLTKFSTERLRFVPIIFSKKDFEFLVRLQLFIFSNLNLNEIDELHFENHRIIFLQIFRCRLSPNYHQFIIDEFAQYDDFIFKFNTAIINNEILKNNFEKYVLIDYELINDELKIKKELELKILNKLKIFNSNSNLSINYDDYNDYNHYDKKMFGDLITADVNYFFVLAKFDENIRERFGIFQNKYLIRLIFYNVLLREINKNHNNFKLHNIENSLILFEYLVKGFSDNNSDTDTSQLYEKISNQLFFKGSTNLCSIDGVYDNFDREFYQIKSHNENISSSLLFKIAKFLSRFFDYH